MSVALDRLERIVTPIPGPRSLALASTLARYESQGVTYLSAAYPVFWRSARGALVTDVDGNRFIDLTAAFGVANVGHTNEQVAAAVAAQARDLIHGMGDVHPTEVKALLLEQLAALATGKSRFIAYAGAYHGLSLGTLDVIGIPKFRTPFAALIAERTTWLPFPLTHGAVALAQARSAFERDPHIAALIVQRQARQPQRRQAAEHALDYRRKLARLAAVARDRLIGGHVPTPPD